MNNNMLPADRGASHLLVRNGAYCNHPDDYLFWDGIHATRVSHAYLAGAAVDALSQ